MRSGSSLEPERFLLCLAKKHIVFSGGKIDLKCEKWYTAFTEEKSLDEPKDYGNFKIISSSTQPVCAAGANMCGFAASEKMVAA